MQILGFLGADVIKLEEPMGGDIAHRTMRDRNSGSLFFRLLNDQQAQFDAQCEGRPRQGKRARLSSISTTDVQYLQDRRLPDQTVEFAGRGEPPGASSARTLPVC
jgi:crotonobetainyl-CoA:carnitine CoA-transferase CaiB-like acyl-CoA transferase